MYVHMLRICYGFRIKFWSIDGYTGGIECKGDRRIPTYKQKTARGEDLLTGYSKIVRMGPGEIYAGGTTLAEREVPRIGIGVIIERAKEEDTEWSFYDTWQKFNENTDRVSSKKYLDVEGDYYYRVRCIHSAGNDMGSSFTDGVYIEEP